LRLAGRGRSRLLRRAAPPAALVFACLIALALGGSSHTVGTASGQAVTEPTPQTDVLPARNVTMLGASPGESPGETWGIGELGSPSHPRSVIVQYTSGAGWSLAPGPLDDAGHPLSGFEPAHSVIAGAITTAGSGALLGTVQEAGGEGTGPREALLVRDRGGAFTETEPAPEALLSSGEQLFSPSRAPLLAAVDEGGHAGAFVVPVRGSSTGVEDGVLHWDGKAWTRETIEDLPAPSDGFRVLAIGASSASNAWLLVQVSSGSNAVALYSRHAAGEGEPAGWRPVALQAGPPPSEPQELRIPVEGGANTVPFTVAGLGEPPTSKSQLLSVTTAGVWIDGQRGDTPVPVTMFFRPANAGSGEVQASWCNVSPGLPVCTHAVPDSLPTGASRSFAWADPSNASGFGQRVITGLLEGVTLRLDGDSFTRVLSLGGWKPDDVGASLGAAFSDPREGWLGSALLPVHLTVSPAPGRLIPYPVPFRRALVAVAPQPRAPVGALSSGVLAVGDQGQVARYVPNEGWMPESLLGPGGRRATPLLRGVAWPTPSRAYAVGEKGQMWLWRGETGLWEEDPAAPVNLTGELLGIAFDPQNPSRGYAIGQGGLLLRFGKSWTQDALPPEVAGASFTSIAFAGSQAIVAFRQPHLQGAEPAHYTSGLLVNEGSGWYVDQGATAALGGALPWAVAGLPDGGAAVSAEDLGGNAIVLERQGPGTGWQPTPVPYSGFEVPSSLALFREGGALRAIGSGRAPRTLQIDTSEKPPPAGFPPSLVHPYPLTSGYILRQTASGWSDEQPDRNSAQDPPGEYKFFDMVSNPDPTSAVLIDPGGTAGWAVGGIVDTARGGALDTSEAARYPADGVPPPGFAPAPLQADPRMATFAVGGNAICAAPCADRAKAGVGPEVWLSSALAEAGQIAGVRAFLYTGPHVTSGAGHGQFPVPFEREFGRYAQLLGSSGVPAYAAATPTDRGPGSECVFEQAFAGFPAPFGIGPPAPGMGSAGRSAEPCSGEGQSGYYALQSGGSAGSVRVIMVDNSVGPGPAQLAWISGQLQSASQAGEPAIAVGHADVNAQIAAGDSAAAELAQVLVSGGASAYFYDAPERNVTVALRAGGAEIPTFGSGTLGYVDSTSAAKQDFTGHSGFLLAEVNVAARNRRTNRAPVTAPLIPLIGQLAMEAKDGVLLRRSAPSLFAGLARRPLAGGRSNREANVNESALYTPIPANCVGGECARGIFPNYTFSSSRTDIGDFVAPNLASPDPHAVLLGAGEKPIPDAASGLFCAYNAGTTVVTISAGGLSASLTVTVQAGSVRRPCGTQPLKEVAAQNASAVPPPPAPAPGPTGSAPPSTIAPVNLVPPPAPVAVPPAPPGVAPVPSAFLPQPAPPVALLPFVPLPVPTPARPTPPSGTSAVTSPVEAPEKEEEQEEATEQVGNKAVAYRTSEQEPAVGYVLGMVILAAFAGATIRRRPRSGRRGVRVSPATISTMRSQRRMGRETRRGR
jgi:hypothetical protein